MKITKDHGFQRAATPRASAEMNLTPLIDVLLVLLIIFMASVTLSQRGLDVAIPKGEAEPPSTTPSPQIVVEVGADRRVTINTQPVELAALETRLRGIFASRQDRTLFVRGDGSLRYGEIVAVIDAAHGAGIVRVGIVTPGAIAGASSPGLP